MVIWASWKYEEAAEINRRMIKIKKIKVIKQNITVTHVVVIATISIPGVLLSVPYESEFAGFALTITLLVYTLPYVVFISIVLSLPTQSKRQIWDFFNTIIISMWHNEENKKQRIGDWYLASGHIFFRSGLVSVDTQAKEFWGYAPTEYTRANKMIILIIATIWHALLSTNT